MTVQRRVFITGRGALSPSGMDVAEMWDALISGRSALAELRHADLSDWVYRFGGELPDYQPAKLLPDRKLLKVLSKQDVLGLNAAKQAIEDSGLLDYRQTLSEKDAITFNDDTGVFVASPGNKYAQQYDFLPLMSKTQEDMKLFAGQLFSEVHPMWLLRILPNNVLAYTSMLYGFKGENHNIVNHVCGGMQAIIEAYHAIQRGLASRVVVVGYDLAIEPQGLFYYGKLGVLSENALRPFDKAHNGTLMAEGAGAIVLESEESMIARQRQPYAEIKGAAAATEGGHLFTLDPTGAPLKKLLKQALSDVSEKDISMVVAHGNANPLSDGSEAAAITDVLNDVPVTAFKWSMGHTLCASALIDTVLALSCLEHQQLPGVASLSEKAASCAELNVVSHTRSLSDPRHALLINRGFAGMNAALILSSPEHE